LPGQARDAPSPGVQGAQASGALGLGGVAVAFALLYRPLVAEMPRLMAAMFRGGA
jgi:hypothetical protein